MNTTYWIYDQRYYSDPDSATVFEVCDTLKEARENKDDYGGGVIVKTVSKKVNKRSYEVVSSTIIE